MRLLVNCIIWIDRSIDLPVNDTTIEYQPTRLEHSYFNDRVYWNLSLIDVDNEGYTPNTTIHPRIAWKVTNTTTTIFPEIDDVLTPEREWVWPSTTTAPLGTFPFEPLTHGYNTHIDGVGKKVSWKYESISPSIHIIIQLHIFWQMIHHFVYQHVNEHLMIQLIIFMIFVTREPTAAHSIGGIPGWSKFHIIEW